MHVDLVKADRDGRLRTGPAARASPRRQRFTAGLALTLSVVLVVLLVVRFHDDSAPMAPAAETATAASLSVSASKRDALLRQASIAAGAGHFGVARKLARRAHEPTVAANYEALGVSQAGARARLALTADRPRLALRIVLTARRRYAQPVALKALAASARAGIRARRDAPG